MNNTVFHFTIDLHDQDSQVFVPVRKFDTAYKLSAMLTEGGTPYQISDGTTVVFAATLPNGSNINESCTVEGNRAEVTLPPTLTALAGRSACCLILESGALMLSTPTFTISVEASAARKSN